MLYIIIIILIILILLKSNKEYFYPTKCTTKNIYPNILCKLTKGYPPCMDINPCKSDILKCRPEFLTFLNGIKGLDVQSATAFINQREPAFNVVGVCINHPLTDEFQSDRLQLHYNPESKIVTFIKIG